MKEFFRVWWPAISALAVITLLTLWPTCHAEAQNFSPVASAAATSEIEPSRMAFSDIPLDYQNTVLADSPTAYWRLGESSGHFQSLTGHFPSDVESVQYAGYSLLRLDANQGVFNGGSSHHIEIPNFPQLNTAWTLEAWVEPLNSGGHQTLIGRDTDAWSGGNGAMYFKLSSAGDAKLAIVVPTSSSTAVTLSSVTTLTPGNVYHVAATYDGATLSLYINGVLSNSTATGSTFPHQVGKLTIGAGYFAGSIGDYVNSFIDEVAIYSTALSSTRIAAHYAAGSPLYFDPQPSHLIDLTENFSSDHGQFTLYTEGVQGAFAVTGGQGVITNTGEESTIVTETASSYSMPQVFTSISVDSNPTPSGTYDNAAVGIYKDGNNFLAALYRRAEGLVSIQIKVGGSGTFLVSTAASYTLPFKIGLSLVENSACLWIDRNDGNGWQFIIGSSTVSAYDFSTAGNLTGYKAGFEVASKSNSQWKFSTLQSGRFGAVGMRDITVVTNQDGSTYSSGGKVTFLATGFDPRAAGTLGPRSSYQGVWTLDMSTLAIEQVGVIMVSRSGHVYNDHAGQVIWYVNGDRRLFISSWGTDPSVSVLEGLISGTDILSGTNVVSGLSALALTQQSSGRAYDPFAVFDGTKWLVAYTASPSSNFFPALDSSTDLSSFTSVGSDSSGAANFEGSKIVLSNHKYWPMWGGPFGGPYLARIYDSQMNFVDDVDAVFTGGSTQAPHPMIFAYGSHFYILTFDYKPYVIANIGQINSMGQPRLQWAARYW